MLKNCRGFSMLEVLASFSIVILLVTFFVPMMSKVYMERIDLEKKREALSLLHDQIQQYLYDEGAVDRGELFYGGETYFLTWNFRGEELLEGCVLWEGVSRSQNYKKCIYAKK